MERTENRLWSNKVRATVSVVEVRHAFSSELEMLTLVFANWNMGSPFRDQMLADFNPIPFDLSNFYLAVSSIRDFSRNHIPMHQDIGRL
jgi:hypothetical protein